MNLNGQIEQKLKILHLTGILQTLPVRLQQAEKSSSGYEEFLMMLLEDEYERRQSGRLLKRLKKAGFEEEKTLEGFDFSFNPQIPVKKIKQLANCTYIENKENIFLLGPVGCGKEPHCPGIGTYCLQDGI
jgi:DNA replication protein DnaC